MSLVISFNRRVLIVSRSSTYAILYQLLMDSLLSHLMKNWVLTF